MPNIDFTTVKMTHNTWRLKLRGFLDGREGIDPKQLTSHQNCELGKWLYSTGMSKYGHLHEMQELEKKHKLMHGVVKQVVDLKTAGKAKEAEQEFSKIKAASDGVVALLTSLEKQIS